MGQLLWEKASSLAEEIRTSHHLTTPVDLYNLCDSLDVAVYLAPMGTEISGLIVKKKDQSPEIAVNSQENAMRRRFTIAHEIGHYMERSEIARDEDFSFSDKRGAKYDMHEFFADEFAGSLLMPEDEVKALHRAGKSTFYMAEHFQVSPEAMRKRVNKLSTRGLL